MINEIELCELSFSEIESVSGGLAAPGCKIEVVMLCDAGGSCTPTSMVVCRVE